MLTDKPLTCYCPCHTHPGTYPTSDARPCNVCGHVHANGEMVGSIRDGWRPSVVDPDPRPADTAELARLVAVELRKRGIWAGAAEGTKGVVVLGNPADWTPWRNGYYYDMACKTEWSSLGPVRLADAIASLEAVRAQEWAGDS